MRSTSTFQCASCGGIMLAGERFCGTCGAGVQGIRRTDHPVESEAQSLWDATLRQLRAATLGEFEIKRELGRGGMAAVYLAHEIALNRKVALKVMAPGTLFGEGMIERFRVEAQTIANLSHAHIVRIHAVRQLADIHFFVMQYMEGRSLERVVHETGPLPIDIVRIVLSQIGGALAYAHRRGVVHRDIKPGNILFDSTGDAVITDFGIAKVAAVPSHTIAGSVVGTPTYMSPEQCFALPLTGASDQYSLGIVAYEMLTGSVPFSGSTYVVMQGHTHGHIAPIADRRPDCPPDLAGAVTRMLARQPADRFASMTEMVKAVAAPAVDAEGDLRERLIALAASEESAALNAAVPTPVSPIPQTRAAVKREAPVEESSALAPGQPANASSVTPVAPTPIPARDRTVVDASTLRGTRAAATRARLFPMLRWLWLLPVVGIVTLAAVVIRLATRDPQPPVPKADSLPPTQPPAVARTDSAKPSAPPATETPSTPPPVPTRLVIVPPRPMPIRVYDEIRLRSVIDSAGVRRSSTGVEWRSSAPTVATVDRNTGALKALSPGRTVITARSAEGEGSLRLTIEPSAVPTPPTKSATELREELDETVRRYAQVIESRNLARLRSVYPAIPASEIERFRVFFENARDVRFTIRRIDVSDRLTAAVGSVARARVQYWLDYRMQRAARESGQWQIMLERTASSWRITSVR